MKRISSREMNEQQTNKVFGRTQRFATVFLDKNNEVKNIVVPGIEQDKYFKSTNQRWKEKAANDFGGPVVPQFPGSEVTKDKPIGTAVGRGSDVIKDNPIRSVVRAECNVIKGNPIGSVREIGRQTQKELNGDGEGENSDTVYKNPENSQPLPFVQGRSEIPAVEKEIQQQQENVNNRLDNSENEESDAVSKSDELNETIAYGWSDNEQAPGERVDNDREVSEPLSVQDRSAEVPAIMEEMLLQRQNACNWQDNSENEESDAESGSDEMDDTIDYEWSGNGQAPVETQGHTVSNLNTQLADSQLAEKFGVDRDCFVCIKKLEMDKIGDVTTGVQISDTDNGPLESLRETLRPKLQNESAYHTRSREKQEENEVARIDSLYLGLGTLFYC